jgi:hypothetical protein
MIDVPSTSPIQGNEILKGSKVSDRGVSFTEICLLVALLTRCAFYRIDMQLICFLHWSCSGPAIASAKVNGFPQMVGDASIKANNSLMLISRNTSCGH